MVRKSPSIDSSEKEDTVRKKKSVVRSLLVERLMDDRGNISKQKVMREVVNIWRGFSRSDDNENTFRGFFFVEVIAGSMDC